MKLLHIPNKKDTMSRDRRWRVKGAYTMVACMGFGLMGKVLWDVGECARCSEAAADVGRKKRETGEPIRRPVWIKLTTSVL